MEGFLIMSIRKDILWLIALMEDKICSWISRRKRAEKIGERLRGYARMIDPAGEPRKRYYTPQLSDFMNFLKLACFSPDHIVDIGANHGNWTREVRQFFPDAKYTLFEPQPYLRKAMADLLIDGSRVYLNTMGVGKKSGEMLFTIHERDDSCSFTWTPEMAAEKGYQQIKIPVTTLDAHIQSNELPWPDMVKIDAEGWDLEVLEGATKVLENATLVFIEAAVGNPRFRNTVLRVCTVMDVAGYRPLDFTDLNRPWKNRVLWLVEMAFVKKGSSLDSFSSQAS
jgi:FkbM family methyltransferase